MARQREVRRWRERWFTALVCLIVLGISGTMMISPDKVFSSVENRYLEKFPKPTWERIRSGEFGEQLERYVADQFPFRDDWVTLKAWMESGLNKKENNEVYAGKDGYLLQKLGKRTVSLKEQMAAVQSLAEALNIPMYFMLAPNSASVLAHKLPAFAPIPDQRADIKEACELLSHAVRCVDLYDALEQHRNEEIYYRTDHHWTTLGAYYAYQVFAETAGLDAAQKAEYHIEQVSDSFYGSLFARSGFRHVRPDTIEVWLPKASYSHTVTYVDEDRVTDTLYAWERLNARDQYPLFLDGNHALTMIKTPQAPDRTLLIIKDSYAHAFVPFLTKHYRYIHMADLRYLNMSMEEYARQMGADEVLLLYNVASFQEDANIVKLKW